MKTATAEGELKKNKKGKKLDTGKIINTLITPLKKKKKKKGRS